MSHWYDKDGSPRYEIEGKNGLRPTTLRDARKHGWVPSVSTIWKDVVAAPGLVRWSQGQLWDAFYNNPLDYPETEDEYKMRVWGIYRLPGNRGRIQDESVGYLPHTNHESRRAWHYDS